MCGDQIRSINVQRTPQSILAERKRKFFFCRKKTKGSLQEQQRAEGRFAALFVSFDENRAWLSHRPGRGEAPLLAGGPTMARRRQSTTPACVPRTRATIVSAQYI
jgi:hypothetical protein